MVNSPDGELATRADLSNPGALSIDSSGVVVFVERDSLYCAQSPQMAI
jgi:hypothetical protein